MKLNTVAIQNYRGLSNAKIPFDGKSTVLFGINGSGKTSILRGINLVFCGIIGSIVQNRFKQDIRIEADDVKIGASRCEIELEFAFMGHICYYRRIMDKRTNRRLYGKKIPSPFLNILKLSMMMTVPMILTYQSL